jgi:hypothetical protein
MSDNPDSFSAWRRPFVRAGDITRGSGPHCDGDPAAQALLAAIATMIATQEQIIANHDRVIAGRATTQAP